LKNGNNRHAPRRSSSPEETADRLSINVRKALQRFMGFIPDKNKQSEGNGRIIKYMVDNPRER